MITVDGRQLYENHTNIHVQMIAVSEFRRDPPSGIDLYGPVQLAQVRLDQDSLLICSWPSSCPIDAMSLPQHFTSTLVVISYPQYVALHQPAVDNLKVLQRKNTMSTQYTTSSSTRNKHKRVICRDAEHHGHPRQCCHPCCCFNGYCANAHRHHHHNADKPPYNCPLSHHHQDYIGSPIHIFPVQPPPPCARYLCCGLCSSEHMRRSDKRL